MNFRALAFLSNMAGAAMLCCAITAHAQKAPEDTTPPPPEAAGSATDEQPPAEALPPCEKPEPVAEPAPPPPAPPVKHANRVFAPGQIAATTGVGAGNYFGTALNSTTDAGVAWDARLTFGAHSIIALEAGYIGSQNNVDNQNGNHGHLAAHGVDTDFRLQLPTTVQPYVFGGVGYNHMEVIHNGSVSNAGPLSSTDDQVTVPAGAGLSGYLGKHATLDVRGTYRFIPDNGLTEMSTNRNLHQWIAQANLGYVF